MLSLCTVMTWEYASTVVAQLVFVGVSAGDLEMASGDCRSEAKTHLSLRSGEGEGVGVLFQKPLTPRSLSFSLLSLRLQISCVSEGSESLQCQGPLTGNYRIVILRICSMVLKSLLQRTRRHHQIILHVRGSQFIRVSACLFPQLILTNVLIHPAWISVHRT